MRYLLKKLDSINISILVMAMIFSTLAVLLQVLYRNDCRTLTVPGESEIHAVDEALREMLMAGVEKGMGNTLQVVAGSVLTSYRDQGGRGGFIRRLRDYIRGLRYGDANRHYLFVVDGKLRMVVHPDRPELEGKDVSGIRDPNGIYIFKSIRKACIRGGGEAGVRYLWPRNRGGEPVPKITFVKYLPGLDWYLCTGIHPADMDNALNKQEAVVRRKIHGQMRSCRRDILQFTVSIFIALVPLLWCLFRLFFVRYRFHDKEERRCQSAKRNRGSG